MEGSSSALANATHGGDQPPGHDGGWTISITVARVEGDRESYEGERMQRREDRLITMLNKHVEAWAEAKELFADCE